MNSDSSDDDDDAVVVLQEVDAAAEEEEQLESGSVSDNDIAEASHETNNKANHKDHGEEALDNSGGEEVLDDDDDGEEALHNWKQLVFQRPGEAMSHLELFASGGFEHLLVLNLQQNAIQDIAPLISVAPTLRVLNVAHNEISQLPGSGFWREFQSLTLCFLAHNQIHQWRDMEGLQACEATLSWLTLHENPIMSVANARPFVVNKLPFLRALDDFVVTDMEYMKQPGSGALLHWIRLSTEVQVSNEPLWMCVVMQEQAPYLQPWRLAWTSPSCRCPSSSQTTARHRAT